MTVSPGPGAPYGPVGDARAQLRVTTADRDRAIELLQKAYSEGRLTKDEYDSRSERALTAVIFTDLDALVRDLTPPVPAQTWGPPVYGVAQKTNALAITALVCGIAQFAGFWLLGTIPAVICGHIARRQVRRTGEQGAGMALAGVILGWVGVGLTVVVLLIIGLGIAAAYRAAHTPPANPYGG